MTDYISREAAFDAVYHQFCASSDETEAALNAAIDETNRIPAADVRPVVRGKWEDVEVTYVADKTTLPFERISSMRCNQCNRYHTEIYYYGDPIEMVNFCPNCGADMREES